MHPIQLSASVMCVNSWKCGAEVLQQLKQAGVEYLHADVMDGRFVPNMMLGTASIRGLREASPIPLDIHMMVERPEDMLDWFDIQPGEFVSIHAESTAHLQRVLSRIREKGARPMAAINPATPLSALEEVLPDVDGVLVMTVNPGFAGQKLVPQTLEKLARLRRMLDDKGLERVRIQVDGNVNFQFAPLMRKAGADMLVCGTSSVFRKDGTVAENCEKLRRAAAEGEA